MKDEKKYDSFLDHKKLILSITHDNSKSSMGTKEANKELASIESGFNAIAKHLNADPEDIIAIIVMEKDDFDFEKFPDLFIESSDLAFIYHVFNDDVQKTEKRIWKDKYWACSPGSNYISCIEYKGFKICYWTGANWDNIDIFMKKEDYNKL